MSAQRFFKLEQKIISHASLDDLLIQRQLAHEQPMGGEGAVFLSLVYMTATQHAQDQDNM
jgi:hypothetical protein